MIIESIVIHVDYQTGLKRDKMIKLIFNNNQRPNKMTQQLILVVVVILCVISKTPRAFVAAEESGESTIPEFGECCNFELYEVCFGFDDKKVFYFRLFRF